MNNMAYGGYSYPNNYNYSYMNNGFNNNYNSNQYLIPNGYNYSQNNQNVIPITLTWNVNAYVKNKISLGKRIKNLVSPPDYDDYSMNYNQGYDIEQKDAPYKQILNNVSGIVKPGQLCAIMGASGSGKTTLLNILNFRNKGKMIIDGEVKLNGEAADWDKITRYSGYVQQDDLFNGTLTVREHLSFAAMLKMGSKYTIEERNKRIDEVINELNLGKTEDTMIGMGDKMKGISGGEKRRLAFASEIITNPPLLFCDEPTSGLDSFMALSLVESMSNLAAKGRTVICTIHQPSSQIFEKFDTLCLLAEGRLAYLGPSKEAEKFFETQGFRVPELYNPADFYIQTLAVSANEREISLQKVKRITDSFQQSQSYSRMVSDIQQAESNRTSSLDDYNAPKYSTGYLSQIYWLFWRQLKLDIRNPLGTKVLAAQSIVIAIFLGLIYLRLDNNEKGVQNRAGVLFITIMQCNFGYIFGVVNTFPKDLILIYRESKNRLYSLIPFFFVKQLAELPKFTIMPFIFVTIVYWMAGIRDDVIVYLEIAATLVLCTQVAVSYGLLISCIAPNLDAALALVVPILMPLLLFGGFFLNSSTTPVYFIWIKYLSWFYYTNECVNVLLWRTVNEIPCTTATAGNACIQSNCYRNGQDVLSAFSFSESNLARNYLVMISLIVGFRALGFLALRLRIYRS